MTNKNQCFIEWPANVSLKDLEKIDVDCKSAKVMYKALIVFLRIPEIIAETFLPRAGAGKNKGN